MGENGKYRIRRETAVSLAYGALLLGLFGFALYVRAIHPLQSEILGSTWKFAADDAVLQMRLVDLSVRHFPQKAFFDPFTLFPWGATIHFGPFWTLSIAYFGILQGWGLPSQNVVDTVGAFFPAVMGALVVFPVYVIGREIGDRRTGLLAAALVATLPGQFLSRSVLGFTDHHVAEVFFMTSSVAAYLAALRRSRGIRFEDVLNRDWARLRRPLSYSAAAGFVFGLYTLFWPGGILFLVSAIPFLILQYSLDHLKGRSTDYLCISTGTAMLVSILMFLPYVDPRLGLANSHYGFFQPASMSLALALCLFLSLLSRLFVKKRIPVFLYPLLLAGIGVVGFPVLNVVAPGFAINIASSLLNFVPRRGGPATVAEASSLPINQLGAFFGTGPIVLFFASFVVLGAYVLFYRDLVKNQRHGGAASFLLVWGFIMTLVSLGQNRFTYYFVSNVAVGAAVTLMVVLEGLGLDRLHQRFTREARDMDDVRRLLSKSGGTLMFTLAVTAVMFQVAFPENLEKTWQQSNYGPGGGGDWNQWYDSLLWMRDHTPDPQDPRGLNFSEIYLAPPGKDRAFPYPKKSNGTTWYDYERAYGVMSWWDYGNVITYHGHRIPNANPFQSGIGIVGCPDRDPYECQPGGEEAREPDLIPGAAPYLVEVNESKANDILDRLGTRYMITDWSQATGKFGAVMQWANGGNSTLIFGNVATDPQTGRVTEVVQGRYFNFVRRRDGRFDQVQSAYYWQTVEARTHFFDGSETRFDWIDGRVDAPALRHYRLVYESSATVATVPFAGNKEMKFVKIFEYLRGARIQGTAPPGTPVVAEIPIRTNQGRTFNYTQTAQTHPNGTYQLILPYSNEEPQPDWPQKGKTEFATRPTGPWRITAGPTSRELTLTEDEVLYGATRTLDMGAAPGVIQVPLRTTP